MSDSAGSGGRNGAQGDPATAVMFPPGRPALETPAPGPALVVRAAKQPDTRPRVHGVLLHRMERIREAVEKQLLRDIADQELSRYAFMDEVQLATVYHKGKRLTLRQQRLAREFEKPKKEAAVAISVSHERLLNAMRSQTEQKSISINVERAVIRVPDTKQDNVEDAVIIDSEG